MEIALRQPIILQEIFNHLKDYSSLKDARLVCTTWNEVILTLTPAKIELNVDEILNQEEIPDLTQISPKLARKITIHYNLTARDDLETRFTNFCDIFGNTVEQIFATGSQTHVTNFVLNLNKFNNLASLQFGFWNDDPNNITTLDLSFPKLEPKSRLTSIETFHDDEKDAIINLVQLILDASPSLTRLDLDVPNTYPDFHCIPSLARSKNLKYLTWIGRPWTLNTTLEDSTFDMKKLTRLLSQVAPTLRKLYLVPELRFSDSAPPFVIREDGYIHSQSVHFNLPKMPNLVKFENRCFFTFPLSPSFSLQSTFPNLVSLVVAYDREILVKTEKEEFDTQRLIIGDFFEAVTKPGQTVMKTVKKIKILDFQYLGYWSRGFQRVFPNLQKLTLTPRFPNNYFILDELNDVVLNEERNRLIQERKDINGQIEYFILSGLINYLSVSGADRIEIFLTGEQISNLYSAVFSLIMNEDKDVDGLLGDDLKHLTIVCEDLYELPITDFKMMFEKAKNEPDWNETRFQDFLSSLKTKLDRLELTDFTLKQEDADWLKKFIQDNDLPIFFIRRIWI